MSLLLRLTGVFALLLFLTPALFVLKYYVHDRPREAERAALVSTESAAHPPPLDSIAPPLTPTAPGNAAVFYAQAIQSYADRTAASPGERRLAPRAAEVGALLEGARRVDSRFFTPGNDGRPLFTFSDPERGRAPEAYRYPLSAQEPYFYLGAAGALAHAVAQASSSAPAGDRHQVILGRALVRFGEALGRERATRTHLEVSYAVQKMGLSLLLPFGEPALRRYVDGLQLYEEAVQAKYALLEPVSPDNIALQERVALHDADPMWRREAVWALGDTIRAPGMSWQHPMEALTGKATLAQAATQDADPSVRAAASQTLGGIAQRGAVIRR